jgi:hypothetical protein
VKEAGRIRTIDPWSSKYRSTVGELREAENSLRWDLVTGTSFEIPVSVPAEPPWWELLLPTILDFAIDETHPFVCGSPRWPQVQTGVGGAILLRYFFFDLLSQNSSTAVRTNAEIGALKFSLEIFLSVSIRWSLRKVTMRFGFSFAFAIVLD